MTIEELKELAERIDKNNQQLTADIAAMKQDCNSEETREALMANAEKYQQEIIKALSCIPESITTFMPNLFDYRSCGIYYYKWFYYALRGDLVFIRKDGVWHAEWDNKVPSKENLTNFIASYRKDKEKVLNDVADLLKKANDFKLHEAKDVLQNTCIIKAAANSEEED